MQQIVSITSQGQLTIPREIRNAFKIFGATKALIEKKGNTIIVKPKNDFWSLPGSLKSNVKLSNAQLKEARQGFSKNWAKK